ncbi:response regulator transcription factor [Paenibacillus solanacearum]|uniref:response regulator transcription factor n=1 Tax=Paenibacillus solanacearum TaxID=2048548 RepID=UPI001C405EAB|nr:response regulator transcription factor [Paenibacillus solanacearum]
MEITILLVEDDPVWRTMLTRFLNNEPDLQVLQSVETKEDALAFCSNNKVDIVLMDINLTDNNLDGIQATLELSLKRSSAKVIALTSLDNEKVIIDTYTAGAIQYVSKSDFRKIPDVIRGVLHSTSPQEILVKEFLRLKEAEQYSKLTAAEKEIVVLSEEGIGRSQLIDKLGKSEGTLKNQITSILRKFKASSMKEVIRTIKSRGLSDKELDR